jgi:hypothetical protein
MKLSDLIGPITENNVDNGDEDFHPTNNISGDGSAIKTANNIPISSIPEPKRKSENVLNNVTPKGVAIGTAVITKSTAPKNMRADKPSTVPPPIKSHDMPRKMTVPKSPKFATRTYVHFQSLSYHLLFQSCS